MVSDFQRARSDAQKEQRRAAILQAAAALLDEGSLEAVGLNAIARRAGIAKSNVYRYFESREQILLELLTSDEAEWVGALELALAPLAEQGDVDAVADIIARTLAARPRLCLLSATLSSVLEQNLSSETIEAFKDVALGLGVRIANTLHAALPALSVAAATELVHYVHALIAGLWPMGHPPEAVRAVVAAPRFAVFRHAFPAELQRGVRALLRGFLDR